MCGGAGRQPPLHKNGAAHHRAGRGSGSGDRSTSDSLRNLFAPQLQLDEREIQKPSVFGGVFASFCRRGQKDVAPERETSLPLEEKRTGRWGRRPLRRDRRKCAGIRWCADAGRRGHRPLRRDRRECVGIRGCADTGRRGRQPLRGARPETWRDKCGRGVPIGGVQTRDAGTGGVFRRTVIDRCGPSGRRIQNYVGCKALPLYGAGEESFRAVRRSGSGDRSAGDSVRNLFVP